MSDNRECGWLGCGRPECEPVCKGIPAPETDVAIRVRLVDLIDGHKFDYVEWDSGFSKCRHRAHVSGYSASCPRAWLAQQFEDLL